MLYDPSRSGDDTGSPGRSEENKRGKNPKILPVDQDFTSWLFNSNKSADNLDQLSLPFPRSTSNQSYKRPIAPTTPDSFRNTYPNTRCILDCTELFC